MPLAKCNGIGPTRDSRQEREGPERKSDKEFNLEAVGFRTYENSLFEVLKESSHAQFMALIGLTKFLRLSWGYVHKELAMEFLKNYKKKKSPKSTRISINSIVRRKKITLTKKLIATTFQLSYTGYKHKKVLSEKSACSSLFDPVTARRHGYHIRDCKDPAYFERLEALNRLICLKPPGQLLSAGMVDMVIHAAIQNVDWAGLLLASLMKELDRVTSSLRQSPCTLVGVHIFLILSNLKIATFEDRLLLESVHYVPLDGYSTTNSITSDSLCSSPSSPLPIPQESLKPPGSRLAELLGLKDGEEMLSGLKSHRPSQPGCTLAEVIGSNKVGQCLYPIRPGSVQTTGKYNLSPAARLGAYFKRGLQLLRQCASAPLSCQKIQRTGTSKHVIRKEYLRGLDKRPGLCSKI